MEEFEKIDWTPNIEDLIDNEFISEARLQREGIFYKILHGGFQDPFRDIRPRVYKKKDENNQNKNMTVNNKKDIKKAKGKPGKKKKKN